nr:PREDICTED: uncharacterized protein LOC103281258 [Anolis carolinensis]|eukprot:XP_008120652.1 PREDICTED: uncharacterized protein LOC103281258 [Anolis carolinensis]
MLSTCPTRFGHLFLSLCVFLHIRSSWSSEMETEQGGVPGLMMEQGRQSPDESGAQGLNRSSCEFTFHLPWPQSECAPAPQALSPLASQEELDHLKMLVANMGEALKALEEATGSDAGKSRYQDLISEALPDVREANGAFHESMGKFLQELEDHTQVDQLAHVEDEKKKLKEHLRMMDHLLRVTGRLAKELDQMSQTVLETLTEPLDNTTIPTSASPLVPF